MILGLLAQATTTEAPTAVPDAVVHVPGPTIYWPALLPLLILMVGGLLLLTFS